MQDVQVIQNEQEFLEMLMEIVQAENISLYSTEGDGKNA